MFHIRFVYPVWVYFLLFCQAVRHKSKCQQVSTPGVVTYGDILCSWFARIMFSPECVFIFQSHYTAVTTVSNCGEFCNVTPVPYSSGVLVVPRRSSYLRAVWPVHEPQWLVSEGNVLACVFCRHSMHFDKVRLRWLEWPVDVYVFVETPSEC